MLNTISYKPFEIILIDFPFADLDTTKKRPALVLSTVSATEHYSLLIVAMISSNLDGKKLVGDMVVKYWKEAGLLHPSRLRLAKLVTADSTLVLKKLGVLEKSDQADAKKIFRKVFAAVR